MILIFLVFIVYNYAVQDHIAYLFREKLFNIKVYIITTLINGSVFTVCIYFAFPLFQAVLMLFYLVSLIVQVKLIYKKDFITTLFPCFFHVLALFLIEKILGTVYIMISGTNYAFAVWIVSMLFPILLIFLVKKIITRELIDLIILDNKNLFFSTIINLTIYLFMVFITIIFCIAPLDELTILIRIKSGVVGFTTYLLSLAYSFIFAKLKINVIKFEELSSAVDKEKQKVNQLESISTTDSFTGLHVRSIAEGKINELLSNKESFFVVLFDIDGLKIANDEFGHDEGDFYIKTVANILSTIFNNQTVSRFGGDEFLVVGSGESEYSYKKKVLQCCEMAKNIALQYEKKYPTSVSFGIVSIDENDDIYAEDIIKQADNLMYDYKKKNKKTRKNKVISIHETSD